MKIILATKNQGKLKEFEVLARNTDLEFETLPDHITELPEETGSTFKENALIKAEYAFKNCGGVACLADDSGLEVDFLNGEPGIFSSRYSEEGTDESNMEKLLHELKEAEDSQRSARFKCSLMLLTNDNDYFAEGSFEGLIAKEKKGSMGFGYDPIFIVPKKGKHLAELNEKDKNAISHRALAFNELLGLL